MSWTPPYSSQNPGLRCPWREPKDIFFFCKYFLKKRRYGIMHSAKDQLLNTLKKYITRKNDLLYFEVIMFLCAFWFKQNRLYVNSMKNLKLKFSTPKCGNKSRKECPTLGNILFL